MSDPVTDATTHPATSEPADIAADETPADSEPKRSFLSRLPGILVRVVSWTVLVVCGLLIVGFVLVPRLTGSTPYTVLTGSMRPTMPPGTTVVVKPIEFSEIKVGDAITYQLSSGEPEVVTHRVIGINVTADGVRLETKGDANPKPDPSLVREEQVRGKVWYWLPVIGYVTNGVTSDTRTWLAQGLGVALIGYAVVTLIVTVVRRKKKGAANESQDTEATPLVDAPEKQIAAEPIAAESTEQPSELPTRRSLRQQRDGDSGQTK